jgi:hypothetical protein
MMEVESGIEFGELEEEDNAILQGMPNHILVNFDIFNVADGTKIINAAKLAHDLIQWLQIDDSDDDEVADLKRMETGAVEWVLAFLWAVATEKTQHIELGDIPEDPGLNKLIRSFKEKAEGRSARLVSFENSLERGVTQEGAEAIALSSSQTMVLALNRLQESQDVEKARRENKESLLKSMGPDQKGLFTSLCTTNMDEAPVMTDFVKELTKSKSPQKAISLLKATTRDWAGTFSGGGCHCFLSGGFLSTDTNRANPGGFSVFMFFPKYVDGGGKAFDGDTAKLRDYFGLKVEDTTIAYYAPEQGYFSPENPHDLHIQLTTMQRTLEFVTCKRSLTCKGFSYQLDPDRWEGISAIMHD